MVKVRYCVVSHVEVEEVMTQKKGVKEKYVHRT